jgi:histidinol-phosphate aminotransferase
MSSVKRYVRPLVQKLHPYTPGEQPRIKGLIKLNTNENPYPPAPAVLRAIRSAVDERLRLYPNPTSQLLREKLAAFHKCASENIFVGNGSDEVLALAVRAFVEPAEAEGREDSRSTVQYFAPSYSLYPVLAETHGATTHAVPLNEDFSLPENLRKSGWDFKAALSLITTPNAPGGRGYSKGELGTICKGQKGIVLLDEAYVDFARENALELALRHPNVLVARTFSKAYSLCFLRVGYCVGNPELIGALDKIRDSYNVNGIGQIAAVTTLDHLEYYRKNFRRIIETREWLSGELSSLGFNVLPSETNFILAQPPKFPAREWLEKLRERQVLVRWFKLAGIDRYLRITIGTRKESEALLKAARKILNSR